MYKIFYLLALSILLISCTNSGENKGVIENSNSNVKTNNDSSIVVDATPPKNESNFITIKDLGEK